MKQENVLKAINDLQTAVHNIGDELKVIKNKIQAQDKFEKELNKIQIVLQKKVNELWLLR